MFAARRLLRALVVVEHAGGKVTQSSLTAVAAAAKVDKDLVALVAGAGADCDAAAEHARSVAGVGAVLKVSSAEYAHLMPENTAKLIAAVAASPLKPTTIVGAHTAFGKSCLPRAAALCDAPIVTDISAVTGPRSFARSAYAGNAVQTVEVDGSALLFLTSRTTSFEAAAAGGAAAAPVTSDVGPAGEEGKGKFVERKSAAAGKVDLGAARVVITGGRGLKNGANFKILEALKDVVPQSAVGTTRPLVDAGELPADMQVGQTGRIVAPPLYLACGVSGAIQHVAGMKDSKVIVSINTDAEAPMNAIADYTLVADAFEAVPKLTALVAAGAK